ncbi:MAG: hypothetical protein ACT4PG_14165 [Panacagrimonas sp.]
MSGRGIVLALMLVGAMLLGFWWYRDAPNSLADAPQTAAQDAGVESAVASPAPAVTPDPAAPITRQARVLSGQSVQLIRMPRLDVPSPPYAKAYAGLRENAEQAPPAQQYQLGQLLYRCRDAAEDETALAQQLDRLHQTRRHQGWDVDDPAAEERNLRQVYADCAGIPASARQEYRDWMRRAADGGLVEAQLNLMFHLPKAEYCQFIQDCTPAQARFMTQLREEARVQVGKALENGSVEALRTVGGWLLNEEMGTPNPVEAYAHFHAYDQIQQAAGRERELTLMLNGLRRQLRPVDLSQAESRSRELLANPNCCVLTR